MNLNSAWGLQMTISKQYSRYILPYSLFIICVSILFNEVIFHTLLHPEKNLPDTHHVALGAAGITVALLFATLWLWLHNKKTELATRNIEWQNTFNSLSEFVSVHDRDFKIMKANRALCELLGKTEGELVGQYCYRIFHDASQPVKGCPHVKAMETHDAISTEIFDTSIGIPLHVTCSPFIHENGAFMGSIHVARPVTDVNLSQYDTAGNKKPDDFLSVCAWCKDVCDKKGNWSDLFDYIHENTGIQFTHSICSDCKKKVQPVIIQQ